MSDSSMVKEPLSDKGFFYFVTIWSLIGILLLMVLITQGATNYLPVTCQEKQLLTSPYYLMRFYHESTKVTRYCICSDVNTASKQSRNQKLELVETSTPTAATNQIKLDKVGSWLFYIYEQASSTNLSYAGLTEVERGQAWVLHTASTMSQYTQYPTEIPAYTMT